MPGQDFQFGPLSAPPPGLEQHEIDLNESLRQNADTTNEGQSKLQHLLNYLHMFEENQITDFNGYKHIVLSRRNGGIDDNLDGCLRPYFFVDDQRIKAYFRPAFLLIPGGDGGVTCVPLPPKFQGIYLDEPPNDDPQENHQLLSDGEYSAWLKVEGYDANITIVKSGEPQPAPPSPINQGFVWHLARWTVENSGTSEVKITDGEYFACPFCPTLEVNTTPFFPYFYQKRRSLESTDPGPEEWFMKVWFGAVHDIHTGNRYRVNNADAETELSANSGATWWVQLLTSQEGLPTSATLIQASAVSNQVFQPPEADSGAPGQAGEYYFKAFDILSVGDRLVPRMWLGSDIVWYRWLHENVGGCPGRVYKRFNTTSYKHEFRTIQGAGIVSVYESGDCIIVYATSSGAY